MNLLTAKEASQIIGVSVKEVRRLARADEIEVMTTNAGWIFWIPRTLRLTRVSEKVTSNGI